MENIYVFDEVGDRYLVNNIEAMLEELPEEGLEGIYKSTRYYHHYNKAFLQLIEHGIIQQTEGEEYDVEGVERGLKAFSEMIITKLGQDTLNEFNIETDAQWEANKPPDLKEMLARKEEEE